MPIFQNQSPIYQQICEYFKSQMLLGALQPGEKVASVRDLALRLGVNPNTMQKSLSLLEGEGLLRSERTSGRYVTDDASRIAHLKEEKTHEIANTYLNQMQQIGYERNLAYTFLGEFIQKGDDE